MFQPRLRQNPSPVCVSTDGMAPASRRIAAGRSRGYTAAVGHLSGYGVEPTIRWADEVGQRQQQQRLRTVDETQSAACSVDLESPLIPPLDTQRLWLRPLTLQDAGQIQNASRTGKSCA